jgi:hypothetical protein
MFILPAGFTGKNQPKLKNEYNMDENEAESETDKQAALAGNDKNLNGKYLCECCFCFWFLLELMLTDLILFLYLAI